MKKIAVIFFLLVIICGNGFSQHHQLKSRKDSSAYNTSLVQVDALLLKLETVTVTLDSINKITKNGFDTKDIEDKLPGIEAHLKSINDNLVVHEEVQNIKNLQMFQVLLEDLKEDLSKWRTSLFKYNRELVSMKMAMKQFAQDSSTRAILKDTVFGNLYMNELLDTKTKWKQSRHSTDANLLKITQLQARVSKAYFQAIDLDEMVQDKHREFGRRNFGKEYAPIYEIGLHNPEKDTGELVKRSYSAHSDILNYYLKNHWLKQLLILAMGIGFFYWVFNNFKKVTGSGKKEELAECDFRYINPYPVLASLVLIFNLAPFFDLNPPSAYVEMTQLFLLIALTFLFAKNWPRQLFYYWLFIILLYILFTITGSIITPGIKTRSSLLALNTVSVIFGILFTLRIRKALSLPASVKIISSIYTLLNLIAAIGNIFGRVSIAKLLSMAAIFGLTEIIGLSVLIKIIKESVFLQMKTSKVSGGFAARLNYTKILSVLHKSLSVIILVLWLIIFSTNLGIYTSLYELIAGFLTEPRKLGSISFTFGNVLLFFSILYLSNFLQKNVGYFFGESDDEFIPDKGGSRLVLLRLILLIAGFLFAMTVSGFPIDKVTIVLGALGVGIGLGLQNIVNNFVSGIILIFEKPFDIGDAIEVGNKKGRVKDMGIRSSRLLTTEGSEIIVPNADLLSGQVTNWSMNRNIIRSEFTVKVDANHVDAAKEYINKIISENPDIVKKPSTQILIDTISESGIELRVQYWVNNIRKDNIVKSDILTSLHKRFKENDIKLV